jgi:hypothetical protein
VNTWVGWVGVSELGDCVCVMWEGGGERVNCMCVH